MRVAGVDGCRRGWVLATMAASGVGGGVGDVSVDVVEHFDAIVARVDAGELAQVAVDIPIGLADGPRACDRLARARLGPRRASVFPAPPRAALGCADYADALTRCRAATGKGLSKQAFHLLPKIAEVDAALRPDLDARVVEAHPELAFARLAGAPLATAKRDPLGRIERERLLARHFPGVDALAATPPRGAGVDDVLDALVLTLTAGRLLAGSAELLGDGARDRAGRPQQIAV